MGDLFWLSRGQMAGMKPFIPKSHGKPRVDDKHVLSGIIFINRNGLRWHDVPATYGPQKTLYSRCKRWREKGIYSRMMAGLAPEQGEEETVMIDVTHLKAHRTATSMGVKNGGPGRLTGRTKGGINTKLHDIRDSQGRPFDLFVTAGQVGDYIGARSPTPPGGALPLPLAKPRFGMSAPSSS